MKKILIATHHLLYPITHGGIVRIIEEAKFLSKNGFEVHLIGDSRTNKEKLKEVAKITGAHTYILERVLKINIS